MTSPEAKVWLYAIGENVSLNADQTYLEVLDATERLRMSCFLYERERREFLHSHYMLRCILSRYVAVAPEKIVFEKAPMGKPCLSTPSLVNERSLEFNLSHTRGLGACVVASDRRCGVDIEKRVTLDDLSGVICHTFSEVEQSFLERSLSGDYLTSFYRIWTLKEAYAKALGVGFSADPRSYSVLPLSSGRGAIVDCADADNGSSWSMFWFDLYSEYHCAVALEGNVLGVEASFVPLSSDSDG